MDDVKKGTRLLEVYALEIQMYTEQKNNKKLKVGVGRGRGDGRDENGGRGRGDGGGAEEMKMEGGAEEMEEG